MVLELDGPLRVRVPPSAEYEHQHEHEDKHEKSGGAIGATESHNFKTYVLRCEQLDPFELK